MDRCGAGQMPAVRRIQGIVAALVEVTRPEYGIPVIVAVAPALQRLPGNNQVARLTSVIAATGGGERWTGGLPIL